MSSEVNKPPQETTEYKRLLSFQIDAEMQNGFTFPGNYEERFKKFLDEELNCSLVSVRPTVETNRPRPKIEEKDMIPKVLPDSVLDMMEPDEDDE